MVVNQRRSNKKVSGSKYKSGRRKRLYERGNLPALTKPGQKKLKIVRTKGGNSKPKLLNIDVANVLDKKAKKYLKAKIIATVENPANRHFVRQNVITKGSVIDTDKGKAKVTSRPGQDGVVNAVLIEAKEAKSKA